MFELRLVQGSLLKKLIDAIKDLVTDANFDCSATGFSLQAMDSSHVALVSLLLRSEGFEHFRCDRAISMGMNIANMAKMLKCAGGDDIITIKADDGTDTVTFMFESPCKDFYLWVNFWFCLFCTLFSLLIFKLLLLCWFDLVRQLCELGVFVFYFVVWETEIELRFCCNRQENCVFVKGFLGFLIITQRGWENC